MYKLGDKVTWSSQAGGVEKVKVGEIVAVVPPFSSPDREDMTLERVLGTDWRVKYCEPDRHGFGHAGRNHESYLVAVESKSGRGKRTLYWPRVKALRKVAPDSIVVDWRENENAGE